MASLFGRGAEREPNIMSVDALLDRIKLYIGETKDAKPTEPEPSRLLRTLIQLFEQHSFSKDKTIGTLRNVQAWIEAKYGTAREVRSSYKVVPGTFITQPTRDPERDARRDTVLIAERLGALADRAKNWPDVIRRLEELKKEYDDATTVRFESAVQRG